jgi:hypothetical protein
MPLNFTKSVELKSNIQEVAQFHYQSLLKNNNVQILNLRENKVEELQTQVSKLSALVYQSHLLIQLLLRKNKVDDKEIKKFVERLGKEAQRQKDSQKNEHNTTDSKEAST